MSVLNRRAELTLVSGSSLRVDLNASSLSQKPSYLKATCASEVPFDSPPALTQTIVSINVQLLIPCWPRGESRNRPRLRIIILTTRGVPTPTVGVASPSALLIAPRRNGSQSFSLIPESEVTAAARGSTIIRTSALKSTSNSFW